MVAMPDLSGLSRDSAIAAVQSAGLVFLSSSNVDSTSGNNGKVVSQSISSGTLVDYESSITFGVGFYTAPSGPVVTLIEDPTEVTVNDGDYECSPIYAYTKIQDRKVVLYTYRYVDNVKDTSYTPTARTIRQAETIFTPQSTDCGYTAPPAVTCTSSTEDVTAWSSCSNGYREKYVRDRVTCTDGTSSTTNARPVTESCCVTLSSETHCTSCICNSRSCTTTKDILCGSTTRTETTTNPNVDCISSSQTNCA